MTSKLPRTVAEQSLLAFAHDTDASVLEALSESTNVRVLRALARNPKTPKKVLQRLAASESIAVRGFSFANGSLALSILRTEAKKKQSLELTVALLSNPSMPFELLERLAFSPTHDRPDSADGAELLRHFRGGNYAPTLLPGGALRNAALTEEQGRSIIERFMQSKKTPLDDLLPSKAPLSWFELAARSENENERARLACCEHFPTVLQSVFAKDTSPLVRAASPQTSVDELLQLVRSKNAEVVHYATRNPALRAEQVAALYSDADKELRRALAMHPNASSSLLDEMGTSKDLLQIVARHPNLSEKLQKELAKKPEYTRPLLQNPSCCSAVLSAHEKNKAVHARSAVAAHPNTPTTVLEGLANDDSELVRCGVALNPRTPTALAEKLATDKHSDVRFVIARHPALPRATLRTLLDDKKDAVFFEAFNEWWKAAR